MQKRFITLSVILLTAVPCMAGRIGIFPPQPQGGQAVMISVQGSPVCRHELFFNGAKYEMKKDETGSYKTFIPIAIEDRGEKTVLVRWRFLGFTVQREEAGFNVIKRKIKITRLRPSDEEMRDKEQVILSQRELIKKTLQSKSREKYWKSAFAMPLDNTKLVSEFALKRKGRKYSYFHQGVDLSARSKTSVKAAGAGRVVLSREGFSVYGKLVIIDHGWGIFSGYYHLENILKKEGESVEAGDIIAESGATGWATGPHLHFSVFIGGSAVDPLWWIGFTKELYKGAMPYCKNEENAKVAQN